MKESIRNLSLLSKIGLVILAVLIVISCALSMGIILG
jgi:hypothetical protein